MVSNEVFRARYREGVEHAEAARCQQDRAESTYSLHTQSYRFKKGHRIMVQVQSTLVPAHRSQSAEVRAEHLRGEGFGLHAGDGEGVPVGAVPVGCGAAGGDVGRALNFLSNTFFRLSNVPTELSDASSQSSNASIELSDASNPIVKRSIGTVRRLQPIVKRSIGTVRRLQPIVKRSIGTVRRVQPNCQTFDRDCQTSDRDCQTFDRDCQTPPHDCQTLESNCQTLDLTRQTLDLTRQTPPPSRRSSGGHNGG